jgi:hypothetical protein
MKNFAVINKKLVENTIIADSLEIAQEITGKTCVEYSSDIAHRVYPGCSYEGGKIITPKPFPSWVLNDKDEWVTPKEEPLPTETSLWAWDEETVNWVEVEKPEGWQAL